MSKAERTRQFIIEQTAPVFNKQGYAGTSLNDLTAATGLTKGAIYGNFENKEAVALAAFEHNLAFVFNGLRASAAKNAPAREKLLALPRFYRQAYPELRTQVASGWGSALIARMENGELDAAAALFPSGKIFPEGIASRSIGRMHLRVVAAKGSASKRSYKLKDCYSQGWVLNPDGCGFRAGLQRALSEQGLSLQINLETFGTELQLGLVANGQGLGLVPEPLLAASRHRDLLEVVNVSDFKPQVDLWLFHPSYLGNLQEPVELFGSVTAQRLAL